MKHVKKYPCNTFLSRFLIICIFPVFMLAGCGTTDSGHPINLDGSWNFTGLEGIKVNVLEPDGDELLIGSEAGLFSLDKNIITLLGLEDYGIRGAVRTGDQSLLVGVNRVDDDHPAIFRQQNGSSGWEPFQNNYGGDSGNTFVNALSSVRKGSDMLFAKRSGGMIARSLNGGESWKLVRNNWDSWGGLGMFAKGDLFTDGRIWSGGVTAISKAYLLNSDDFGETWMNVTDGLSDNIEGVAYDVVTHSDDPDKVLTGLGGGSNRVMISTNGGETWKKVLENTAVHNFARSPQNPNLIYASGRDASTKLFFAYTTDFGETWKKQIFEEGPDIVTTNDMTVMTIDGKEVIFFGTDRGLFSFVLD